MNIWRRFICKVIIKLIRKYFKEGVDVITDYDGEVIAYRWAWSKDLDEDFKKYWW